MPPKIRPVDADQTTGETPPRVDIPEPEKPKRRGDSKKLADALSNFYVTIGGGLATVGMLKENIGMVASGTNIATRADETASAWMELADTNPRIKKFLESFMEGSAIANLVAAHLAMIIPVVASQGLIPPMMGEMALTDEAKQTAAQFQAAAAAAAAAANQNGAN